MIQLTNQTLFYPESLNLTSLLSQVFPLKSRTYGFFRKKSDTPTPARLGEGSTDTVL